MQKTGNKTSSLFFLLVDEERFLHGGLKILNVDGPSSANTINMQLTAGQAVRVENQGSTQIYGIRSQDGAIESWFTGFMLYEL